MVPRRLFWFAAAFAFLILAALCTSPHADADPTNPGAGEGGAGGSTGGGPETEGAPAEAVFLCPGVGSATLVLRTAGGGYCDFDFNKTGHIHCEWGGFSPVVGTWNCWRVWPGRPDHPQLPDPDIIPDGWGVPNPLNGPTKDDQWPPPGLAPAAPPGELTFDDGAPRGPLPGPPP